MFVKMGRGSKMRDIDFIYDYYKDEIMKDAKANGIRSISKKTFRCVVKKYWLNIFHFATYKNASVEPWAGHGYITAHKILCTTWSYFAADNAKTGGYMFFYFWDMPLNMRKWTVFKTSRWRKRKLYRNVVDNGWDYPEIGENQYRHN